MRQATLGALKGMRQPPAFWWAPPALEARLLSPLGFVYGRLAGRAFRRAPMAEAGVPVLCVGNFTVGGGGKTPTAITMARAARAAGHTPGFVTRGYGRKSRAALLVDPQRHSVADTGDEPLILAQVAPTAVSADRITGADLLKTSCGVDFVIMDDGFQSARLAIDFALIAIDARRGLGNGAVVPAGPLRASLADQLPRADAVLIIGEGEAGDDALRRAARANLPIHRGHIVAEEPESFEDMRCLAFAGIADPSKFYDLLANLGAQVVATRDFPDHHAFSKEDMDTLSASAWKEGLQLVTTRKDVVRLAMGGADSNLFSTECEVLDVSMRFDAPEVAARIIRDTAEAFRRRRLSGRP